jgi:HK97 family phage major capsid protein
MINSIKDEISYHARAAQNILDAKGSVPWTLAEQRVFDSHIHAMEETRERAEARDALNQREGLSLYLRHGMNNRSLTAVQSAKVVNAMSTTTPSEGGYTVSAAVAAQILSVLKGYGWVRAVASEITTSRGDALNHPTSDGTSEVGELLTQNSAAASLDASFGSVSLPVYRFSSKVITVPVELLQDSEADIVAFIAQRIRDRIGRSQNAYFTTGTGTGQPQGIVTGATSGKVGTTGQTATVIYDDLVELADSVDAGHLGMPSKQPSIGQPQVGWMMSQAMRKVVRKLKDTNGRPIWMPAQQPGGTAMLLDTPVYMNNDMPSPAANAKTILYGNLASYLIRDALDIRILRMDDSAFARNGQVGFIGFARAGGALLDTGAVKFYQHPAT